MKLFKESQMKELVEKSVLRVLGVEEVGEIKDGLRSRNFFDEAPLPEELMKEQLCKR